MKTKQSIYIVKRIDFDGFENSSAQAISIKPLGYVKSKEKAMDTIGKLEKESPKYNTWASILDGNDGVYPKFEIEEVKEI